MLKTTGSTAELQHHSESSESFKNELFEGLFELEERNFWFRSRNRLIIAALKKYFPTAESFCEIGCGTGFVLTGIKNAMPHLQLFGSELFEEGLVFARGRLAGVELMQMDARTITVENAFDVIGSFDVLEHIDEDELVLSRLFAASRKGIILTVPQHEWLWSSLDDLACHKRRYSRKELLRKVEAAGFRIERITSFVSLLLPLMFLSRLRKKDVSKLNYKDELVLPYLLDRCLELILMLESFMIMNGLDMPWGGSLILVATKAK